MAHKFYRNYQPNNLIANSKVAKVAPLAGAALSMVGPNPLKKAPIPPLAYKVLATLEIELPNLGFCKLSVCMTDLMTSNGYTINHKAVPDNAPKIQSFHAGMSFLSSPRLLFIWLAINASYTKKYVPHP
ncbi:hypothetical protein WN66_06609 [Saccharomyces cerevisiae]|uniref:Putative uncharacterized protein YPR059C n=2 Tax=Saccharomyces cerevisiae TaxID=4932 RepID=YP059_YEAST|nr:RecName: Full=Putative uncharacterized protein YPR059C [Saccharomyces cerevisiae S288C]KZV07574.1 hypothetical protein WN66_06609 [Saccharomyces cerevisiae]CAY87015.1 EC1118_1P2_3796p [Saccharomyces cerevisiae EC1118]